MIGPRPAGFWIRALAALVDFVVFFVVYSSFKLVGARVAGVHVEGGEALKPLATFFTLVFAGAYTSVLHHLAGQTIGKMLVGVRVVAEEGPPPFGASLLRFVGYFASAGTFTIGFVMAGLRQDKRALHDLIAGTRVERTKEPEAAAPPPTETEGPAVAGAV